MDGPEERIKKKKSHKEAHSFIQPLEMRNITFNPSVNSGPAIAPVWQVFVLPCVAYCSVQPETPLSLAFRFGARSPLSCQRLSAGDPPGERGCTHAAHHTL